MKSTAYCFTTNNYTSESKQSLIDDIQRLLNEKHVIYAIIGDEVSSTGTPHLQGYVHYSARPRIGSVRKAITRSHVEVARGSPSQNRDYCKKDGSFIEFGVFDDIPFQGKRSEFDRYKEWILQQSEYPGDAHIAANWTNLYCRYADRILKLRDLLYPKPILETADYREGWQSDLLAALNEPSDDRKITFYVDAVGNEGKSWFIRKYLSEHTDGQYLSVAKRDDIAHIVDPTKRVFLVNVPRGSMQYLQYGILESIKDRMVFSPKYNGTVKFFVQQPHVVVFTNDPPDPDGLSADRLDIKYLN